MSTCGGSSFGCGGLSRLVGEGLGDAAGGGRRAFRLRLLLRIQQRHRGGLFGGRRVAPEQRKRLVEHVLVLVAVDHGAAQRGAGLDAGAEVDMRQRVLRGDGLGRPDRQPGAAQQAGEMHDVGGEARRGLSFGHCRQ